MQGGLIVPSTKPILEKWNKWSDLIYKEVVSVHLYRKIYRDVRSMVKANPEIQKPSVFYAFTSQGYVILALIIIRREVTEGNSRIALAGLLRDTLRHPTELSRQHYRSLHEGRGFRDAQIDRDFRAAGAAAGRDFIDPMSVLDDLATLTEVTRQVRKYTNKAVAHIDARTWTTSIPTLGGLNGAIDTLARVFGST
jgi:hypothetical protein